MNWVFKSILFKPICRLIVILCCLSPALAYWQSRDSNYNKSVGGAASYSGPGDIVTSPYLFYGLRAVSAAYATGLGKLANICTPLDVVCADVNSDANGNFNLSGTGSLVCNNLGSICTVKILYEQVGASPCTGTCDMVQATIANRPVLTVNCLGTLVCMTFAGGSSQNIAGLTTNVILSQPFTFSAVGQNTGSSAGGLLSAGQNAIIRLRQGANQTLLYAGSLLTATASDNVWHAYQGILNDASSDLNVDGSSNTGAGGSQTISAGQTIQIGNDGFSQFLTGTVVEAGIWPIAFSAGNMTAMSANQHSYWGF